MEIREELYEGFDRASQQRLEYSRRAFGFLPELDRPRILDAGCGRGDVALELARLCDGEIIGIDIDDRPLRLFEERIEGEGLEHRVHALHVSILEMDFAPESFDIVWAEASLHIVGMSEGFEALYPIIKPGGFLVVHEMVLTRPDTPADIRRRWKEQFPALRAVDEFLELATSHNYQIINKFAVPHDFWEREYYDPLERRIELLREKYSDNREALAILDRKQYEADLYHESSQWIGSFFFILQRTDR